MIEGLVVSLVLILHSSTSHSLPSAANTSTPTNHTSYSSAWNPYEFRPPPPPTYNSPWLPPEDFYDNFDPRIADIVRDRVQDILNHWRTINLPPLYHCRYTCEQYILPKIWPAAANENPTPPHDVQENSTLTPTPNDVQEDPTLTPPVHENPTIPPPPSKSADNCPTMAKVLEACTSKTQHESVNNAYSWDCGIPGRGGPYTGTCPPGGGGGIPGRGGCAGGAPGIPGLGGAPGGGGPLIIGGGGIIGRCPNWGGNGPGAGGAPGRNCGGGIGGPPGLPIMACGGGAIGGPPPGVGTPLPAARPIPGPGTAFAAEVALTRDSSGGGGPSTVMEITSSPRRRRRPRVRRSSRSSFEPFVGGSFRNSSQSPRTRDVSRVLAATVSASVGFWEGFQD
nr:proline-rich protein 3-like isoform X2 [Ipomoea batatas]